jgi:hypothetical protein
MLPSKLMSTMTMPSLSFFSTVLPPATLLSMVNASLHRAFVKLLHQEQTDKFGTLWWKDLPGMKRQTP